MRAQRIFLFLSFLFLFSSCQQDLLESPSFEERGSYPTGQIESPNNVTATQGGYREVSLTWRPSKLAKQYFIYSCDSSTGTFTKCAETADETPSFSSKEDPGILKYYRVTAVDSLGNESEPSGLCFGTTLFTPVITKITKDTGGTAVTVHWYGGSNVYESTYLNVLCYEIVLFDIDGKTPLKEEIADGTQNSLTFSGLEANRQYYFQVKAYLKSTQDDGHTEKSDLVNESTAHRMIPDAPEELTAKKGVNKTEVELSWKLPASVDVKSGSDYIPHPVYFKVLRKELSAPDDAYQSISTYIGVVKGNEAYSKDSLKESEYRINCQDGTISAKEGADTSLIIVKKPDNAEEQTNAYYPEYISGTTITFKDTTAQVGKQYSYRVQSYTDDNGTRLVTSEESVATDSGWLITNPSLRTKVEYAENEDKTQYTGVTVSFAVAFEDFGVPYKYVLYETCYTMNNDGTQIGEAKTTEIKNADSVGGITGRKEPPYETKEKYYYYYTYMLKVCSVDRTEEYRIANAPGAVLVVQDKSKQPVIEEFSVKDGFTGYFVLSWLYDERCAYTISWKNTDKNGHETDSNMLDLTESDITLSAEGEGKTRAVYRHPAENGDSRIYTLTASNGLKATETLDTPFRTLKIPELQFTDIEYDKITVSWEADTMSDGYTVTAQYDGDAEGRELAVTKDETVTVVSTSEDGKVSCVITKPFGYNRAELSGKAITLKVSTKSTTCSNEEEADKIASASVVVRTLGPAATDTGISEFDQKSIQVKWNEVPGANGYKIYRTKYIPDGAGGWKPEKVDVYYRGTGTTGTFIVSEGEGEINKDKTKNTFCNESAGEYTLCDTYREPGSGEENNQYAESQSQISWGLPYSYTVIPVRDENDFAGNIGAESGQFELEDTSKVVYTDIAEFAGKVKGATLGYGLNLVAAKAESGTTQDLQWDKPYSALQDDSANLVPVVYRRKAGTEGVFEPVKHTIQDGKKIDGKKITSVNKDDILFDAINNKADTDTEKLYVAFEYIVKYDKPGAYKTISVPPSLLDALAKQTQIYNTPEGERTEQNNKGYLLTLENFNATVCSDKMYYEELSWKQWDYDERAVGPDGITIFIHNNNIDQKDSGIIISEGSDSKESKIYWDSFIEVTGADARTSGSPAKLSENIEDVTIEPNQTNRIYVAPKGIIDGTKGTTDGLLKVLRDYKHNYTFKLFRKVGEADKPVAYSDYEDDYIKTAYRQITDEELVKGTLLTLAYTLYLNAGGKADLSNVNSRLKINDGSKNLSSPNNGKAQFESGSLLGISEAGKYKINFTLKDYAPEQLTPGGATTSLFALSMNDISIRAQGASDYYLDKFRSENFTVTVNCTAEELKDLNYAATLTMTCTGSNNLCIKKGDATIINTTDTEIRKKWFPAQIVDDSHCWIKDSTYGWWPSSN